jgi:CRP-like cAMP-binding protein
MRKNFFNSLAPAEAEAFAAVAVEQSFPGGSRLMSEGDEANYVMVILGGWTRIAVRDNGRERVVAERGPGQLVGERAALRQNVRSATVTALNEVSALVMKTEDFASFISAHPRVLDVVENQIYDRLTENPEGYAQDGWPGALSRKVVSHALRARLQSQSLAGENCTVLLTDVVGFGALNRSDYDRQIIRREGLEMMRTSLGPLWEACISLDRGDGLLVVVPPQVPTARIIECINRELPGRLRLHNRTYSESARFHLRIAAHVGPVMGDLLGVSGGTIIRTARLVEAPVLKEAMAATGAGLGIMVSEFVHEIAIGHAAHFIDAAEYKKVEVSNKEFRGSAWMRLLDVSSPVRDPLRARGNEGGLAAGAALASDLALCKTDSSVSKR